MFGPILERPGLDRPPREGETFFCEDWSCPAWMECEHHFGRSHAYTAFIPWWEPIDGPASKRDKTPFYTPSRPPYSVCEHFRRDKPREWLAGWCSTPENPCPGCNAPECPNAPPNVIQIGRGSACAR